MTQTLRVTYDPEARAGYLYLTDSMRAGEVKYTVPLTEEGAEGINLDFDADGHLIGIELLDPAFLHPTLMAQATAPEATTFKDSSP
jgi:uncharacterized protein YuzE